MNPNESDQQPEQDDDNIRAVPIPKPQALNKRSSLKPTSNHSPFKNIPNKKSKRGSVNWDMSSNLDSLKSLNLKEMKISFKQEGVNQDKRKFSDFNLASLSKDTKKFQEARKMSIKNEFTLVKQMMRNNPIEEADVEDEALENTKKNQEIGKLAAEDIHSDSNSDENENDN